MTTEFEFTSFLKNFADALTDQDWLASAPDAPKNFLALAGNPRYLWSVAKKTPEAINCTFIFNVEERNIGYLSATPFKKHSCLWIEKFAPCVPAYASFLGHKALKAFENDILRRCILWTEEKGMNQLVIRDAPHTTRVLFLSSGFANTQYIDWTEAFKTYPWQAYRWHQACAQNPEAFPYMMKTSLANYVHVQQGWSFNLRNPQNRRIAIEDLGLPISSKKGALAAPLVANLTLYKKSMAAKTPNTSTNPNLG